MTGKDIIARNEALETTRAPWSSFWQQLANYIQTRKSEINTKTTGPDPTSNYFLYDSTAAASNMTMAQGQMSLVSPPDEVWFEYRPPLALKHDESAISYYREVTEIIRELIASSNFYTQIHEMYLQRSGFGTATLFSSIDSGSLFFKSYDIGTYSICEDHKGQVDTFFRTYPLTAKQAEKKFGADNLPEKIRKAAAEPKKCDQSFDFIHAVFPREEFDPSKSASRNMPVASVHVSVEEKHIVSESGFETFPFHVTRYLSWSDTTTDPYGWCPGWTALPDIRQANLLSQYMDVLAETAAFPRILAPSSLEGEVDLRALGITYYDPLTDRAAPTEWATQGRYDIGEDRLATRQKAIEEAYHVDLFKMFGKLDKQAQMSVREVTERASEKLIQFSPTFSRMTAEMFNPLLLRVYSLATELGALDNVLVPESVKADERSVFDPNIKYLSRIALALNSLQNAAAIQTLEAVSPVATIQPDVLDVLNFEKMVRGFARNTGLPETWLRTPAEVEEIQARRQELIEAQQEAEIAAANQQAQPQQAQA